MATTVNSTVSPSVYRSPLRRMLYDSPLHTTVGKIVFVVIALVVLVLAGVVWADWLTPLENLPGFLFGILAGLLGSLVAIALLRYLDRREPESWWYFLGVLLIALAITVAPAAFFNTRSPVPLLTVGINEEFWKVFPLLMLVFFAPTVVTGMRDGLIYGALGGFAFNCMEIGVYVMRDAIPQSGLAGVPSQLSRLGINGIDNHVVWAALLGGAIGLAVQTEKRWVKVVAPLGAYLLVAVTHMLQDLGGGAILAALISGGLVQLFERADLTAMMQRDPAAAQALLAQYGNDAIRLEVLAINIICLPIILWMLLSSGTWERRVIREQLADEVGRAITAEEYEGVKAEQRFRLRKVPGSSARVGRQIRNAQNELAMLKHYLTRRGRPVEGDSLVTYYRDEVARLRAGAPVGQRQPAR